MPRGKAKVGPFELGNFLVPSEGTVIRVICHGEETLETKHALTILLSFYSLAKWNLLSAHKPFLTAGYSKGEEEV